MHTKFEVYSFTPSKVRPGPKNVSWLTSW